MKRLELIATCTFGLEGILKDEVVKLGFENIVTSNGRVEFSGEEDAIAIANLWLRTADRVLVKIGKFNATTFDELFEKTKACSWEQWITKDGRFPVAKATSVKSKLFSKSDCQSIVKKAIVERLKQKYKINWFEESGENYPVFVNILKDEVTLSIDSSGVGLHKRGYRAKGNEAPLKETLAAAIVFLSHWKPERQLADPFCGSGTLLIEAALMGKNIAPGINRTFSSETWNGQMKRSYSSIREEAKDMIEKDEFRLLGSDIDRHSIQLAMENAKLAGVDDVIAFQKLDVSEFSSSKRVGTIITNPPYGERLSTKKEVEELYQTMGKTFEKLDDWSYFILTGHLNFERYFGRRATKNRKLYNGNILTYLYQYYGGRK
ncbi:putative N6-adenine-specific DNA methylase [Alkalibaculum bacchi]|uniref:Putative N6-adenine-specific DNA methylase n=1 Tax=Alkalibaculum bacchi TaxID=645887 RepID=A0A366IAN6_9FIRM|nr:class I SAM-dependent RNA methyltransferase [Alkalibaculum bacchi]RBP67376.1 putative N6-adenine-specific DNA methylase [Alkalibaculum bacchi]